MKMNHKAEVAPAQIGQHTRWSLGKVVTFGQSSYWPIVADGETVARSERDHQAAHIVLACNAHEKLVEALKDCVAVLLTATGANRYPIGTATHTAIEQARAALALVERGQE